MNSTEKALNSASRGHIANLTAAVDAFDVSDLCNGNILHNVT